MLRNSSLETRKDLRIKNLAPRLTSKEHQWRCRNTCIATLRKEFKMNLDLYKALKAKIPDLNEILNSNPPLHYKVYKIPKRKFGFRTIAQPTAKLKNVQRALSEILEKKLQVHKCATAYRKGVSIKDNAQQHVKSTYILKLDLENFFNSITPQLLFREFSRQKFKLTDDDKNVIEQISFWNRTRRKNGRLILSVGAPISPLISNITFFSFDEEISFWCENNKINYTRYADDMTFSTKIPDILPEVIPQIKKVLKSKFGGRIILNETKTKLSSKAHNRHVTGITLTNDNKLSLGRDRKRYISALVHKFKYSQLDDSDMNHLMGLLSFASHIEESFIHRLISKYGLATIDSIIKHSKGS